MSDYLQVQSVCQHHNDDKHTHIFLDVNLRSDFDSQPCQKQKQLFVFLLEDSQLKPAWTVKSSKQKLFSSVNTVSKSLTARREDEEK